MRSSWIRTEVVEAAVVRVREEIQSIPQDEMRWRYALDEQRGRHTPSAGHGNSSPWQFHMC